MSIISCYEPMCDEEAEASCNCTSPNTYSCEKHLIKHFKSSGNPHNISSIFLEPAEDTKEAICSFLTEEISTTAAAKINMITSFAQTIRNYEIALKKALKEVNYDFDKTRSYLEKVPKMQRLSRLEKDPVLSLLALEPDEAIDKAKTIFTTSHNVKQFYEMGSQINNLISSFNEEKTNVVQSETLFNIENSEFVNFEEEEEEEEKQSIKPVMSDEKEAISIEPNIDTSFNNIGDILCNEKRYEEALQFYDDAIRANPDRAIYHINKGNALEKLWRNEESLNCLKEAIRLDPNNDNACSLMGGIYINKMRYEEAVKYYNDAIKINPNKAIYYVNKGRALKNLRQKEEAIECFKEAIKIDPNCKVVKRIKWILYNEEKYEEAIQYYNDEIRDNPKIDYYKKKGKALLKLGRIEEAGKCFAKVIKINPNDSWTYTEIGLSFYKSKRYEEAIKYYDDAIRIRPRKSYNHSFKGEALIKLGRIEEAEECFKKVIKSNPKDDEKCELIGNYFYYEKRYEEAIKYYENAIKISPDYIDYYENKAKALIKLARIEEAKECIKEYKTPIQIIVFHFILLD